MPWRHLGERRHSSYSLSISALDGGEWSASRPGRAFTPGERTPGTHWTGDWVGPRAGLDTQARGKILRPRRGSNPDCPVVQPVVRHYTAWANPAPYKVIYRYVICMYVCVSPLQRLNQVADFLNGSYPASNRGRNTEFCSYDDRFFKVSIAC
jgi:hypothetical protein